MLAYFQWKSEVALAHYHIILFEYNLWGIHLHMGYTYLTDLAHPIKLDRLLGTDLPYIPRWVISVEPIYRQFLKYRLLVSVKVRADKISVICKTQQVQLMVSMLFWAHGYKNCCAWELTKYLLLVIGFCYILIIGYWLYLTDMPSLQLKYLHSKLINYIPIQRK